jgi:hypothetical protein
MSAYDILLSKTTELQQQAQQHEEKGEYVEALTLYQRASEILLGLLNNEIDTNTKVNTALHLKIILDKKERVKQDIERAPHNAPISPSQDSSTACEVVLSVENVSVHQIIGSGQQGQDRRLLGKGVIKILKCSTPAELFLLQLIPEKEDKQFQFPLTKSVPCLCTSPGYYIFPMPGNVFYGVVFPRDIPEVYLQVFERVLDDCCCLRTLPAPPPSEQTTTTTTTTEEVKQETTCTDIKRTSSLIQKLFVNRHLLAPFSFQHLI